jgi:hypothetical protein
MLKQTRKAVMETHVEGLCQLHNLEKLYITAPEAANIWIDQRMVWVPLMTGPLNYYIALHEIGHYVTAKKKDRPLESEARAWNWALDMGKIGATKPVYQFISNSLKRYAKREKKVDKCPIYIDLAATVANKIARKVN